MDPTGSAGACSQRLNSSADLIEGLIGDSTVIVWLASADVDARARRRQSATEGVSAALTEAVHAHHLVLVSSAMVYGAWANNPVPITEEAVLRPDVEFVFARQLGVRRAARRRVATGRTGPHGHRAAARRGHGRRRRSRAWPRRSLPEWVNGSARTIRRRSSCTSTISPLPWCSPPSIDSTASSTSLPTAGLPGERVRALAGAVPRLKLPDRVTEVIGNMRWRFQRGPIPPGLRSYTRWPWLVANDRLKAEGWSPTVTNEQAYVEGTEAKWWTMVSPKRRQEIALSGLGALLFAIGIGIWRGVRTSPTPPPRLADPHRRTTSPNYIEGAVPRVMAMSVDV